MKYLNFKRYKFSTALKKIYLWIPNFSKIYKKIDYRRYNFNKVYKYVDFRRYNFNKVYKYVDLRRYNFNKVYKYVDFRRYDIAKISKFFDIKKYKHIPVYIFSFTFLIFFVYLSIPIFFKYDKSFIEKICKDQNIKCYIEGRIKYTFFPSPRIKFNNLKIKDFNNKNRNLAIINDVVIKISITQLFDKRKFNFTKVELQNAEVNFDLKEFKKYKNFIEKKSISKAINLKRGEINFFEGNKKIATLRNTTIKYKPNKNIDDLVVKGNFLNDDIYVNFINKKNKSKIFILKSPKSRLFTKINIYDLESNKKNTSGDILFKKNKNRIRAVFDYKDSQIFFKHADLRSDFFTGKLAGVVKFLPFFDFNLDVDINGLNFKKLHSVLVSANKEKKRKFFRISHKINGTINLTADKIYSSYDLIRSLETQIKFSNSNILIEKLLLSMGKLGAADITGIIKNHKKFTNFNFENNIFIDNPKRFYNKFGIFSKKDLSTNLFVSGSFDLVNLNMRFNEISNGQKFKEEDVVFIEKEFNDFMLEDGYSSFFNFPNLKEFIKFVMSGTNLSNEG